MGYGNPFVARHRIEHSIASFLVLCRRHIGSSSFVCLNFISIDVWMLTEAVLHVLEVLDAINALWLSLREHKAAKCLLEFFAAWAISHAP